MAGDDEDKKIKDDAKGKGDDLEKKVRDDDDTDDVNKNGVDPASVGDEGVLEGDVEQAVPIDEKSEIVNASMVNEEELEEKVRKNLKNELTKAQEVEATATQSPDEKNLNKTKKIFILLFLLGGIAFASIVGVLLPDAKDRDAVESNDGPLSEVDQLKTLFVPISGEEVFEDQESPQSQALKFLVEDDELEIDFYDEESQSDLIERYVMMVLYYSTDGPNWQEDLLFGSEYRTCEWPNIGENETDTFTFNEVDCDESGNIIKIRLERIGLNGTIPMEISALSSLEIFTLGGNSGVVGTIPTEIVKLSKLDFWQTTGCRLTGTIPTDIVSMPSLGVFRAYRNEHTGTLPDLSKMPTMRNIDVGANQFTGTIPDISPESEYTQIFMEDNMLTGSIPAAYFNLQILEIMSFSGMGLTGTVPTEIGQLEALKELYFQGNSFTGTLPTEIGNLRNIQRFFLSDNPSITGTIPTEIGEMRQTQRLFLSQTQLGGELPTEISKLNELQRLNLVGMPLLTGTIPIEFGELENLPFLNIQNSSLTGGLEEAFCSQESLITSITADCLAEDPNPISCSCCTNCCNDGEDCELKIGGVCENQGGKFERDLDRNATCTCLEGGVRLECTDAACPSCNLEGDLCALNTEYGYEFNETTGEIKSFHNTIEYVSGFEGTTITYEDELGGGCTCILNGEECNNCGGITCQSGFKGFVASCDNVEGAASFNSCEEFVDPGLLEILFAFDPSQLTGCPLLLEKFQS